MNPALEELKQEATRRADMEAAAYSRNGAGPDSIPVFEPLTFDDLMALPPKEWLIENIIGRGDLGMVFGEAGSGKTFVVIDMIFDAVRGDIFADRFEIVQPLRVAYCAGEGITGLKDRFDAAAQYRGVYGPQLGNLTVFTDVPQLFEENLPQTIYNFANEIKAMGQELDLLVVDTFHSATVGADENSAKDANRILAALKHVRKELGCAVLLVHHTNKARSGERGSSAYRGAMDVMLEVSQAGQRGILHCSKLKDGEPFDAQTFEFERFVNSVALSWLGPASRGNETTQKQQALELLQEYAGKPFTAKAAGEAIGLTQTRANQVLLKLLQGGEIQRKLTHEDRDASSRNPWLYYLEE